VSAMIHALPRINTSFLTHARLPNSADADCSTRAAQKDLWGSQAIRPPTPRRLTRREARLVSSVINSGDIDFRQILMAHVREDGVVARTVFKALCRVPEMLQPSAATELLELLRHQAQPKYARNFAIACLRTLELAHSFELMSKCAQVLTEASDTLSTSQQRKIGARALAYPARWSTENDLRPRLKKRLYAWPAGEHPNSKLEKVDYAGAVSILLLAQLPLRELNPHRLLKTAVLFARQHPTAQNLWLTPLRIHAPEALRTWQVYVSGRLPTSELAHGLVRASIAASASCLAFSLAKLAVQPPRPPAQVPLFLTLGLGSTVWTLNVLLGLLRDVGRLTKKYEVAESQARQVLNCK
jgi:hypothetical protein